MKKILAPMIIGVLFMLTPVLAIGASITGSVQGYMCVTQGQVCPIGMEDPVAAVEQVFVLLVDAKKMNYYFVPNVDRVVMARHINSEITIEGDVNEKAKTIKARSIMKKGKKVWSVDLEDRIYKDLLGNHPLTSG
ncbi:MAG: hypothetical protein AB1558_05880 [Thermodesulfobacteriota bacterium]